jgi:hypothetical protein
MNLLERIFDKLRLPDPKPSEGIVIEDQIGVLRAIAAQPGSVIRAEEPYRAGKPLRHRTVERLLATHDLHIQRADVFMETAAVITLTAFGWERITDVDKA